MTLPAYLDAIEARVEAATEGPWKVCPDEREPEGMPLVCCGPGDEHAGPICSSPLTTEDADFIAHARTDLPRLVQGLRLAVEALEAVKRVTDDPNGGKDEPIDELWQAIGDAYATADAALAALDAIGGDKT